MTGNRNRPERYPDRDWGKRPPRKSSDGIPPLRLPSPPASEASSAEARSTEPSPPHPLPAHAPDSRPASGYFRRVSIPTAADQPLPRAEPHPTAQGQTAQMLQEPPQPLEESEAPARRRQRLALPHLRWPRSWLFWGSLSVLALGGIGTFSAFMLFRLPALPNCPTIFWPTASASLRVYCAQLAAERHTVEELLRAISLVNHLPANHPLRPEIDRNIEDWSKAILELAEESFQRGNLTEAVQTAKRIPDNTPVHQLVEQQIQDWQAVWSEAEGIYAEAEAALQEQELREAFSIATRLLEVGNDYWETVKYQELTHLITVTREDSNKLTRAQELVDAGGLSNLLAAIKLIEEIKDSSPLHAKAQERIAQVGRSMLTLAQETLDSRDYNGALEILNQIPEKAGLQAEVRDSKLLAEAQAQAWGGTPDDLEAAIVRAQKIARDRPLYDRAQELIGRWQLEIQDVNRLANAQQLAVGGSPADLRVAIAEAQLIPSSNPRAAEAQENIRQWTATIETVEDRPFLDRAEQIAQNGDVASLHAAINEANRVGEGRALSGQAAERIRAWQNQIQRIEDQPFLTQARQLASYGDLVGAIDVANRIGGGRALYDEAQADVQNWTDQLQRNQDQPLLTAAQQLANQGRWQDAIAIAQQIAPGRLLYDEAQTNIQTWQAQVDGQDRLQQAYAAANSGTTAMLLSAIQIAADIPSDNPTRTEADQQIDRWSWQLLEIAETQATLDPQAAIAIAQSIPSYAAAYPTAQQRLQEWQRRR